VIVDHGEIFVGGAKLAVLGYQPLHEIVDGIEAVGVLLHRPLVEGVDIMTGLGLRLGGLGHVDIRGQEVDLHVDLVLLGPGTDQLSHCVVAGRHPMVPQRETELTGRACGADVHERQCGGRGTECQRAAARHMTTRTGHGVNSR
jgi:hypothetical protein